MRATFFGNMIFSQTTSIEKPEKVINLIEGIKKLIL